MRPVGFGERFQFRCVQLETQRSDGIVKVLHLACADDGRRDSGLVEHPGQRNLRIRHTVLFRNVG